MSAPMAPGAYVPGGSALHRLDARVKVVLLLVATLALFGVGSLPALAVLLTASVCALRAGGVSLRALARMLAPLLVLLVCMVACASLRFDGTGDVCVAGSFGVSSAGLLGGVAACVRIACMVALSLAVSATTSAGALTDALLSLLGPLARLRVPVDDVAMALSIALRFIPVISQQMASVALAQRARGARIGEGGPLARVTSWVPVMIPVVVGLFRRSEALGQAMQARCYRGFGRTRLVKARMRRADVVVLVVGIAACAALALVF